jgi:sugar/nucleoside kinase (ribokinase family)/fructoselysine-6-P-deglycase FrlB-like protein
MEVVGAGLLPVDHMFQSETMRPKATNLEYLGSAGGGSVGNTLTLLSLLGHRCVVTGLVGNDEGARIVRSDFTRFGINAANVVQRGSPRDLRQTRQYSHLIRPDGSHSFVEECLKCGLPFRRTFQMTESDLSPGLGKLVQSAQLLFLDRVNGATSRLLRAAQRAGVPIAFDFGFPRFGASLESVNNVLRASTVVKTQEQVLRRVLRVGGMDAIQAWKQKFPGTRLLLVTRGPSGVQGFWRGRDLVTYFDLPAIECEHLRDTAGAGDVLQAMALHLFLAGAQPKNDSDVLERVNICQALASLKCSLLGARSLQRALLNQKTNRGEILEIGKRIVAQKVATNSFPPTIGLPPPLSNPFRFVDWGGCPVCGQLTNPKPRSGRSVPATMRYKNALSVSHLRMAQAFEVGKAAAPRIRDGFDGPTMFVGSGGSLSAASFATTLLIKGRGKLAVSVPPFEVWNLERIESDSVVCLLSHGGENNDILMAADRLSRLRHKRVIVLTAKPNSPLSQTAGIRGWLRIFVEGQERGFVATSGLLSMVGAICGAFSDESTEVSSSAFLRNESLIPAFNQSLKYAAEIAAPYTRDLRAHHLVVLASGWGWPAAVDFESKLVEGGVCTVELTEMKNFTHGRYVNSFHHREHRHFVLFVTPEEQELARFMQSKISRYFDSVLVVETAQPGIIGAVDLMIRGLFLAGQLAQQAGVDLANPRYPSEARGLYGWAPREFLEQNPGTGAEQHSATRESARKSGQSQVKQRILAS